MWFSKLSFSVVILFFTACCFFQTPAFAAEKADLEAVTQSHYEFLGSFIGSTEKARDAIFYSYKFHINGFAALLGEEEAAQIADGVKQLHTRHSWEFMSLENNGVVHPSSLWIKEGIIIANVDTERQNIEMYSSVGFCSRCLAESKSFSDKGFGPIPSRWRGICENNTFSGVPCNRKLIGARYFNKGLLSEIEVAPSVLSSTACDFKGHGTHTLSTAAGNFVPGANVFGVGTGTAKGGSPKARVAAYKVCFPPLIHGCHGADIIAAIDAAIEDGADVLSISIGGDPTDYYKDPIAIPALHAIKKGIVVVCSAGNSGPFSGTVTNTAPWIITVGASTIDRKFQTFVELGNGRLLKGTSLPRAMPENRFYPLISGVQANELCMPDALDPEKVKGKIVACLDGKIERTFKGGVVALAGGAGMILCNDKQGGNRIIDDDHVLPASHINYTDGLALFSYINNTHKPMGFIMPPTPIYNVKPAPLVAEFSSVGPNHITPEILKPDIIAPGMNVIAGWSEAGNVRGLESDNRTTPFNTDSGTSMACPHVAGVVGLLKTLHPDWSPAAIRSAISTSAATPFHYGSGHIRPNRAMDPGLVYDISVNDYLDFLCAIGYNESVVASIAEGPYECPNRATSVLDLNYPSITVPKLSGSVAVTRKLKNVSSPGKYIVRINEPYGISVSVEPSVLKFDKIGEEKSFKVTLKAKWEGAAKNYEFGGLISTDGSHHVRSPIIVASTTS
ncbi:hypothetical protein P3X46_000296 [Hevea brasiliensis]|uniref:Subtilisin-like protease n=1 Tax=Hevea brasiliensis TaxID=3981 RepID=A0ABQ9N8U7_HEVBR|nr:hypothetical protein P3X46_000296 [Hevea brasiliensis]